MAKTNSQDALSLFKAEAISVIHGPQTVKTAASNFTKSTLHAGDIIAKSVVKGAQVVYFELSTMSTSSYDDYIAFLEERASK